MIYPNFKLKQTTIAIISLLCLTGVSFAAKQIDLNKQPFSVLTPSYNLTARSNTSTSPIKILKSHTDSNQITHMRVQQMHANVPVWGADAVIHLPYKSTQHFTMDKAGNHFVNLISKDPSVKKNGYFYAEIEKDIGQIVPEKYLQQSKQAAAINTLKQDFASRRKQELWKFTNEKVQLIVYVDDQNKSHWAYKVSFTATRDKKIPKQPYAIIDADNQTIYTMWDNIKQLNKASIVKASGFGGNPVLGQWQYGKNKPYMQISRFNDQNKCSMENDDVRVLDRTLTDFESAAEAYSFPCLKITDNQQSFTVPENGFYGSANDAYSPINDALAYGNTIKDMYKEWYGIDVLTKPENNEPLKLSMNIIPSAVFKNAFWHSESQQMFFGLGGTEYYPFVTLGIAAHEVSHGFTDQHSDLVYKGESGAINESFSDMVIPTVSYYDSQQKQTDWSMGWDILKSNQNRDKSQHESVRYFDKPSKDQASIEHVKDIAKLQRFCRDTSRDQVVYQSCFVHFASGIFNKAFYQLATSPGWNTKLAFEIVVKANMDYWISTSNFQTAACGVKHAAIDVSKKNAAVQIKDVEAAFESVGISTQSC